MLLTEGCPMEFKQSRKLSEVQYDLRGPVLQRAKELEAQGHSILKLNIGNPAPFGFEAPDELIRDIIRNLSGSHGYGDSKGLPSARRAVAQPSFVNWRPRATASALAGTSLVMEEPAPMYAPSPIESGATSVELLPTKDPSPICVRCL